MKTIFKKINLILFGNPDDIIENKLSNILMFIGALICLSGFIINYLNDFPLILNAMIGICGIAYTILFYFSSIKKITKPLEIPFQIVTIVVIIYNWFTIQGIEGSTSNFFYIAIFALIYCSSKKNYWTTFFFIFLISVILIFLQIYFPQMVLVYPDKETQIADISSGFLLAVFTFGVFTILVKKSFDKERLKTEFQKSELLKSEHNLNILNTELESKIFERTAELAEINLELQKEIAIKQKVIEKERELNMLKSRFISVVSHEFRTPLAGIKLSVELLERYELKWGIEKKEKLYNQIHSSISFINFLLDDVTLAGKDDAGELVFKPEQLIINDFLKNISDEISFVFGLNEIIQYKAHINQKEVIIDSILVKHILYNLLSNAIKYSDKDIIMFEVTEQPENKLQFKITDKGIGIPDSDKKFLFELFHRAKNAENIKGTGLGLSIVKRCVDLHSGTIEIDSKENTGTTVTVIIPFDLPV